MFPPLPASFLLSSLLIAAGRVYREFPTVKLWGGVVANLGSEGEE